MSDNAKVMFKRGTQASLNTLIQGSGNRFNEGTFYLTNDTNRLYFAQAADKLVDLNQYIHIKEVNLSSLPKNTDTGYENLQKGDIYYWSNQNILAICDNPSTGAWVQLNADTKLAVNNGGAINVTSGTNSYTFTTAVADTKGNSATGSFTLVGAGGATLSASGNTVTITTANDNDDTHYTLGTEAITDGAKLNLTASNVTGATSSSVDIVGSGGVSISRDSTTGALTITGASGVNSVSNAFSPAGAFVTTLGITGGSISSTAVTPTIAYGSTGASSATFDNGTATLNVYTKTEVDTAIENSLKAFDAMEYAGVLQPADAATTLVATTVAGSTPKAGTTYKAGDAITLRDSQTNEVTLSAKAGDLIIAEGTDGNVTWSVVPSGNDQLITTSASGNSLLINDNNVAMGGITVNGDTNTYGTISATGSVTNGINTITVAHGAAGAGSAVTWTATDTASTQVKNVELSVPTVVGLSKDAAGHITSITTKTFTLKDTHANISSLTIGATAANNIATVAATVTDTDNISDSASFRLTSNNLTITSSVNNNVPEINVDLVWGSF